MENKEVQSRELLEIVEKSMVEFHEAMKKREDLSIRIGRRTTQIVRVGAVTVGLLSMAVLYLTAALNSDMSKMSEQMEAITGYMQTMNASIGTMPVMSASVQDMNVLMRDMSSSIRAVPVMTASMQRMTASVQKMDALLENMAGSVSAVPVMSTSVQRMSADMTAMNNQIHFLNQNVGSMGYNVDRMASPMKMFPFP